MRKLSRYNRFNIKITVYEKFPESPVVTFLSPEGEELPDYKSKLTKGQWLRAGKYLTRKLVPFCGYSYNVKDGYKINQIIKII